MTSQATTQIALIGYGNIAHSLLNGLLAAGYEADNIRISDSDASKLAEINGQQEGIRTYTSNASAVEDATIAILCIKPDVVPTVCAKIKDALTRQSVLLVSVAAGVPVDLLQQWTTDTQPIIRCMPNTPVAVGCGMTALYANQHASAAHKKLSEDVFATVGSTIWLWHEKDMHIVTALSGSGPAYFFRFTEAFEKAAKALDCPPKMARKLAIQTLYGAAVLASKSDGELSVLRARITSKGGTTEEGLQVLDNVGIDQIAYVVLSAAASRSNEISDQLEDL